ncbi:MAG: hypothetical protein KKE20_03365 [Nanoarchaeota archaeon]|nr:hypothetical protein [Nanoarchaeota archaeon]
MMSERVDKFLRKYISAAGFTKQGKDTFRTPDGRTLDELAIKGSAEFAGFSDALEGNTP